MSEKRDPTKGTLEYVLNKIINDLYNLFVFKENFSNYKPNEIKKESFFVWLFSYNKASGSLTHWKIYPYKLNNTTNSSYEDILKDSVIRGGVGTIGYVLNSGNIELINNTFLDPRGTVSYEDEIIENYSWAGIPLPLGSKKTEVQCVLSFFYQGYDFFNLDKAPTISEYLKRIINKYNETILLHLKVEDMEKIVSTIIKTKRPSTFPDILKEMNEVLNLNAQYAYTGILSRNKNSTFSLDHILFNTQSLENNLKDIMNWCSISKTKCNGDTECLGEKIHRMREKDYIENQEFDNPSSNCEIWNNYFKYLLPVDVFNIELDTYKIIYYFSSPLTLSEKKEIKTLNKLLFESILNKILKLNKEFYDYCNKEQILKMGKRCSESNMLIFQIISKSLYKNCFTNDDQKKILNILIVLRKSFLEMNTKIPISLLQKVDTICDKKVLKKTFDSFNNFITNSKYKNRILSVEFWEKFKNAIQIVKIDDKETMNEMKSLYTLQEIHHHSNISVIKRAILEELYDHNGNEIFYRYTPLFLSDMSRKKILPEWDIESRCLKINSTVISWLSSDINYLHSINIHPENFSLRVLANIRNKNKEISQDNRHLPIFSNLIINAEENYFLFPPDDDIHSSDNAGRKYIISGLVKNNQLSVQLTDIFRNFAENLYQHIKVLETQAEKKKLAVKAAIAAIMSRNGSHNLGSHVLSAVSDKFNEPTDDQILFKYIQQRMDFIAQITTEFPQWASSTWLIRDIMRRFYMQKNLLSYIAQSECLSAYQFQNNNNKQKNKLLIKVLDKDFNPIIINKNNNFDEEIPDALVAIPGGVVGCQAFYTILENIIRNSAKHSWVSSDNEGNFELYVQFDINSEPYKPFVTIRVFDNCTYPKQKQIAKKFLREINNKITRSFIENTGELRKENWGIAEIKISAGFLAQKGIIEISEEGDGLIFEATSGNGILNAQIIINKKNNSEHFGYEFAIPKPRELLIINSKIDDYNTSEKLNIKLSAEKDNCKILNSIEPLPSMRDYEFIIMDDVCYDKIINKTIDIELFPFRLFLKSGKDLPISVDYIHRICKLDSNFTIEYNSTDWKQIKLNLYRKWIEFINPDLEKYEYPFFLNTSGNPDNHSSTIDLRRIFQIILRNEKNNSFSSRLRSLAILKDEDYNDLINIINDENSDWDEVYSVFKEKHKDSIIPLDYLKWAIDFLINKSEEDIETLPLSYKAIIGKSSKEKHFYDELLKNFEKDKLLKNILLFTDEKGFKSAITNEAHRGIILKRHLEIKDEFTFTKNIYVEALSGSQFYFSRLESEANSFDSFKLMFQILENAFSKILIIDERVSEYFYLSSYEKQKRFIKLRLIIPHTVNGELLVSKTKFDLVEENKVNIVETVNLNSNLSDYNILIIHQGVLDKLWKNKENIKNQLSILKKMIPFIVITSGRGTPTELPDYEKFVPFSDIKEYILKDYPEKILLLNNIYKVVANEVTNEQF
ncbi:MAG: hypothetical protein V1773_07075 [bacterium]